MAETMSFQELQEIVSVCLDELVRLKEENEILKNQIKEQNTALLDLVSACGSSDDQISSLIAAYHTVGARNTNLKYELADPRSRALASSLAQTLPRFYPLEETIRQLVDERKSMGRFGDGEFELMAGLERQKFQHKDERLQRRLQEVLASRDDGFLIAIADNYGCLEQYNEIGATGIRLYMTEEVRKRHAAFLDLDRTYHNAYISRPYVLYADNRTDAPARRFAQLRRIWDGRRVIMVEGALTRMGVGNDLFDNAAQIRRIEAPPTSSFDRYDDILAAAKHFAGEDTLFLIALGPSAGVLAFDLYQAGFQAIDIGHLDLEYEWLRNGTGKRSAVPGKYNNEFPGGNQVSELHDAQFESEILCRIG